MFLKGSPGNLSQFEDLLFGNVEKIEANIVIALKLSSDFKNNKVYWIKVIFTIPRKILLFVIIFVLYFS